MFRVGHICRSFLSDLPFPQMLPNASQGIQHGLMRYVR
jgi:hypothetical protein